MIYEVGDTLTGEGEILIILYRGSEDYFCQILEASKDSHEEVGDEVVRGRCYISKRYGKVKK